MDSQQIWQATLGELELSLSKANFTTWFKNTSISSIEENRAIIAVPNGFTKAWLEKKYHQTILKALKNVSNNHIKEVVYKIESPNKAKNSNLTLPNLTPNIKTEDKKLPKEKNTATGFSSQANQQSNKLNPKYVFSNFIVGKNNELAHAAALAVGKNPGNAYNPLFIYGGVGLGKTHLLQAIGHKTLETAPNAQILYVSCETFTNDYIQAIQSGRASSFAKKYRSVDILLIDDIQFISGKERTQEAFFHTFNELHQQNKQIVLSSDRPPKAIAALEHRLVSRFEWGMIADISTPDLETKIAIIDTKAKEKNYNLSLEISTYLATVILNNIRELEGALNRIIGHSQLKNRELTLGEVKEITSSITTNSQKRPLTPKHIINTVSEYFDISIEDILGACRKKNFAVPRQIAMYLMREDMKASYPTIGHEVGKRDHTTAIHAYEKIVREIKVDDKLRQDIEVIKQRLMAS
jgi:chromosomal replication initiator protein